MGRKAGYVIKLTGSLFEPENFPVLRELAEVMKEFSREINAVFVCGGGKTLRKWLANLRRDSDASEYELDILGIEFTRLNSKILTLLLKPHSYPYIPESILEAVQYAKSTDKYIVMGGVSPGFSTNAVAAFMAKELRYRLVNVTSAGGVYDKDPQLHPDAVVIPKIHIDQLINMLSDRVEYAGSYPLFDLTSLNIIKQYKIETHVISPDPSQLKKLISGYEVGTRITF